jgi:hypothetical protein
MRAPNGQVQQITVFIGELQGMEVFILVNNAELL